MKGEKSSITRNSVEIENATPLPGSQRNLLSNMTLQRVDSIESSESPLMRK